MVCGEKKKKEENTVPFSSPYAYLRGENEEMFERALVAKYFMANESTKFPNESTENAIEISVARKKNALSAANVEIE